MLKTFVYLNLWFQLYDVQCLELLHTLQSQLGMTCLDSHDLLSYEDKEDYKGWRDTVTINLCIYIEKTGRFDQANSVYHKDSNLVKNIKNYAGRKSPL